jgi:uncharacterized protein YkwD
MRGFVRSFLVLGLIWGLYGLFLYRVQGHGATIPSPQLYSATVAGISTSTSSSENPYIIAINNARNNVGLASVAEDVELGEIAAARAADMQTQQYYAHRSPQGFTFVDYFSAYGISRSTYSCENLLLSANEDAESAVAAWLDSPSHRECLLNQSMTTIGFARVSFFPDSREQQIYVTIFAQR